MIQAELDLHWIPVYRHWRLNERMYGGLQGKNKAETAAQYGEDQVKVRIVQMKNFAEKFIFIRLDLATCLRYSTTETRRIK